MRKIRKFQKSKTSSIKCKKRITGKQEKCKKLQKNAKNAKNCLSIIKHQELKKIKTQPSRIYQNFVLVVYSYDLTVSLNKRKFLYPRMTFSLQNKPCLTLFFLGD